MYGRKKSKLTKEKRRERIVRRNLRWRGGHKVKQKNREKPKLKAQKKSQEKKGGEAVG